jgi:hypothetical protein
MLVVTPFTLLQLVEHLQLQRAQEQLNCLLLLVALKAAQMMELQANLAEVVVQVV